MNITTIYFFKGWFYIDLPSRVCREGALEASASVQKHGTIHFLLIDHHVLLTTVSYYELIHLSKILPYPYPRPSETVAP